MMEIGEDRTHGYESPPIVLENVGNTEGNAMSQKEGMVPKFAVGSQVRVKKGVVDPNHPGVPLGGRCGVVSQVSGSICLVRWNGATSEAVRSSHPQNRIDDALWLQEVALEADPKEPLCIEQGEPVGQD
jgi:hypothetical protein